MNAKARIAALEEALAYVRDMIQQLPQGIEEEADEENTDPEDAVQHIGGLIYRCACRALAAAKEEADGR